MTETDALTFDNVDAHGGRIQQQIDNVVVEKIHFVHIQQAAICRSEHARLEMLLPSLNSQLYVERADNAIFCSAYRKVHKCRPARCCRQLPIMVSDPALIAPLVAPIRVAAEMTVGDDLNVWE